MLFFLIFFAIILTALILVPPKAQGTQAEEAPAKSSASARQLRMLDAANSISIMLFSDNFESFEIGAKAFGLIGTAGDADFIELWKIQGKGENTACTQICWWERDDQKTHVLETRTVPYHTLLAGWSNTLEKNICVTITQENSNAALLADLAYHKTSGFLIIPIFFEGALWGFLRLGISESVPCFTDYEQDILRSIGLFVVASLHRYRTQDALKASEDRFRDVTLATGEIVWELDANGFFSYISSRIEEVAGYPYGSLLGKRWEEISTEAYKDVTSQMFQAAITGKIIDNFEHAIVTNEGKTLWFHSAAILLIDSVGVAGLRGTSFNYTKTRETAIKLDETLQALQRSNLELEQAVQHAYTLADKANSANSAKENFLANISHEIRTPLNSISGMVYMLEQAGPTNQQLTYIAQIKEATNSLVTIVDNILNFTNIQAGTVESVLSEFLLTDLFHETASQFSEKLAHKNLFSFFGIASRVPIYLRGDITSLRQIVTNLLDNAIKFTESGAVSLTCSLVRQRDSSNIILQFSITDTGIGVPPDQQEEMLQAFTQKDASSTRRFGGTGLGLTIAHQLIHLNGGTFVIESIPGKGTSIHFTFNLQPSANGKQRYSRSNFYHHLGILVEPPYDEHFFIEHMKSMGFFVDAITLKELSRLLTQDPQSNASPLDMLAIPNTIIQKNKAALEDLFNANPYVIPKIAILTPQLLCPSTFPDYITHCFSGPAFSFIPPRHLNAGETTEASAVFSEEKFSKTQQRKAIHQLNTIISLLEDSDAEGRTRFDELQPMLYEIDEKTTREVNNFLEMFQFAEAVPLLITLKEKLTENG